MKNVNIINGKDKVTYEIPDDWNEVTVEQYSKIIKFNNKSADAEVNLTIKDTIGLIAALTSIPEKVLYQLLPDEYAEIVKSIDFINSPYESKTVEYILIDGQKWYCKQDYNKFTMGEVASIQTIQEKYGNLDEAIPEMLTIFMRKKVDGKLEEYDVEFEDRIDIFKKAKIVEVNNLLSFFLTGNNSSQNPTAQSSAEKV